ncbi:MAG: hypothetical protein LBU64_10710 [Planctomycetota bacterium]|nr:hypothetical protein [Planctomycetota bacterium]
MRLALLALICAVSVAVLSGCATDESGCPTCGPAPAPCSTCSTCPNVAPVASPSPVTNIVAPMEPAPPPPPSPVSQQRAGDGALTMLPTK